MEAEEAERCGLVSRIVPKDDLMDDALKTASKIAEKSVIAAMAIKESINCAFEMPLTGGVRFERRIFHALFATDDQTEGMDAFVEKRAPQFRGK